MAENYENLTSFNAPEGLITDVVPQSMLKEICNRWFPDFEKKYNESTSENDTTSLVIEHGEDITKLAAMVYSELLMAAEIPASDYKTSRTVTLQDLWNLIFTLENMSSVSASNVATWNPNNDGVKPGLLFTPWRHNSYWHNIDVNKENQAPDPKEEAKQLTQNIIADILKASAMDEPSNLYEETFPARLRDDVEGTKRWGGIMTLASPFESDTPTISGSPLVKSVKYSDEAFKKAAEVFLSHEEDILELYTMLRMELLNYITERLNPETLDKADENNPEPWLHRRAEDTPRYSSFYKFIDADMWKTYDYVMRDYRLNDDSDYLLGQLPPEMTGTPDVEPSLASKAFFDISRGEQTTGASVSSPIPDLLHQLRSRGIMEGVDLADYNKPFTDNLNKDSNIIENIPATMPDPKSKVLFERTEDLFPLHGLQGLPKQFSNPMALNIPVGDEPSDRRMEMPGTLTDETLAPYDGFNKEEVKQKCEKAKKSWDILNKHKKTLSMDVAVRTLADLDLQLKDLKAEFAALHELLNSKTETDLQNTYEIYRENCGYELNQRPPKQRFFLPEVFIKLEPKDYTLELDLEKIREATLDSLAKNQNPKETTSAIGNWESSAHTRALMLALHTLVAYAVDVIEGKDIPLKDWRPDIYSSIRNKTVEAVLSKDPMKMTDDEAALVFHEKFKFGTPDSAKKLSTYTEWNEFEKSIQDPNYTPKTDSLDAVDMSQQELTEEGVKPTELGNSGEENNANYILAARIMKWRLLNNTFDSAREYKSLRELNNNPDSARAAVVAFVLEFCRKFAENASASDLNNWNDPETRKLLIAAENSKEARERLMYTAAGAWHMDSAAVYKKTCHKLTEEEKQAVENQVNETLKELKSPVASNVKEMMETEDKRLDEYYDFVNLIIPKYRNYLDNWFMIDPYLMMSEMSCQQAALICPGHYNILDAGSRMTPLLRTISVPKSPISGLRLYDMNIMNAELLLYMRNRRLMDFLYSTNTSCVNLASGVKLRYHDARWLGRRYHLIGGYNFKDEFYSNSPYIDDKTRWNKQTLGWGYKESDSYMASKFDQSGLFDAGRILRQNQWYVHSFHDLPTVLPIAREKFLNAYYGNYAGALPSAAAMLDNMLRVGLFGRYQMTEALRGYISGAFSPSFVAEIDNIRNWSWKDSTRMMYLPKNTYSALTPDAALLEDRVYACPKNSWKDLFSEDSTFEFEPADDEEEVKENVLETPEDILYEDKYTILRYSALDAAYAFLPLMHSLRRKAARELYLDTYLFPVRSRTYKGIKSDMILFQGNAGWGPDGYGIDSFDTTIQLKNYASPFDIRCEDYHDDPVALDRVKIGPVLADAALKVISELKDNVVRTVNNKIISETVLNRSGSLIFNPDPDLFDWESARLRCFTQDLTFSINKLREDTDKSLSPVIGVYSLQPLMKVRKEEERSVEMEDETDRLLVNAKRYYRYMFDDITLARRNYEPFKNTLLYGSSGVGIDIYAAWQAAFLYNSAWLDARFQAAQKLYDRPTACWYKVESDDLFDVWRRYERTGPLRLDTDYLERNNFLPRLIKDPTTGKLKDAEYKLSTLIAPQKGETQKDYDDIFNSCAIDTYDAVLRTKDSLKEEYNDLSYRLTDIALEQLIDSIDHPEKINYLLGLLGMPPGWATLEDKQLKMQYFKIQNNSDNDSPLYFIKNTHLYNPAGLALKHSNTNNSTPDLYKLYKGTDAEREADFKEQLNIMKDKYGAHAAMFHKDILAPELAAYLDNERSADSYFAIEPNRFIQNFIVPNFDQTNDMRAWQYAGLCSIFHNQPLICRTRACWEDHLDYQSEVNRALKELGGKPLSDTIISQTLSELSPESNKRMPIFNYRLPGDYNFTQHGYDDFSQGTPIAVVTDWETLEKKRIEASSPEEAAEIAAKNYREGLERIFPKLESLEVSYDNNLNNITEEKLKEVYGEELGAKLFNAKNKIYLHTDYSPVVEETKLLNKCVEAAIIKAKEEITAERYPVNRLKKVEVKAFVSDAKEDSEVIIPEVVDETKEPEPVKKRIVFNHIPRKSKGNLFIRTNA